MQKSSNKISFRDLVQRSCRDLMEISYRDLVETSRIGISYCRDFGKSFFGRELVQRSCRETSYRDLLQRAKRPPIEALYVDHVYMYIDIYI